MIRITLIALSSLKERCWQEAAREYAKRLGAYCRLQIVEIKPCPLPEKPSAAQIESALEREAGIICAKIPRGDHVVALCIEGNRLSSEEFAEQIKQLTDLGKNMTFLIGSSHGLSETVKRKCQERLSFSPMTFPHQLFRVMWLEQLYRAFQIMHGGEYHK